MSCIMSYAIRPFHHGHFVNIGVSKQTMVMQSQKVTRRDKALLEPPRPMAAVASMALAMHRIPKSQPTILPTFRRIHPWITTLPSAQQRVGYVSSSVAILQVFRSQRRQADVLTRVLGPIILLGFLPASPRAVGEKYATRDR